MKKILYLLVFVLFFYISLPMINYYALTKTFFFDTLDDCLKSDVITLCPDSLAVEPENIRIKFFVETNQLDVIFLVRKETNTYLKKLVQLTKKEKISLWVRDCLFQKIFIVIQISMAIYMLAQIN